MRRFRAWTPQKPHQRTLQTAVGDDQHGTMNHGSEWTRRIYRKEEEFLEDWYETVDAVLPLLRGDWRPNFQCDDRERERRRHALATGELKHLMFDGAAVFHAQSQLSSIQIELRSSTQLVFVRVWWANGEALADIVLGTAPGRCTRR